MSVPALIDTLEFVRSEQSVSGSLPVGNMKRLEDVLFDGDGSIVYEVRGGRNERNRPQLGIRIAGELHLQCQRCLGPLDYPIDIMNIVLLVPRGADADEGLDDPDAPDAIEASAELDVAGLIEDEVLLSLPLAPRHPEGTCASRITTRRLEGSRSENAFAKLAALKRPRNKH